MFRLSNGVYILYMNACVRYAVYGRQQEKEVLVVTSVYAKARQTNLIASGWSGFCFFFAISLTGWLAEHFCSFRSSEPICLLEKKKNER